MHKIHTQKITLDAHPIASTYPMMSDNALNNLISSMEQKGYDKSQPIIIYDGKILDGRNRYKASTEASVEPEFVVFEGTFDEAMERSRQLNSNRRHLAPSQLAIIAAKEVLYSRANESMKNLSLNKAAAIHCTSETYIKIAIKVLEADEHISNNVFNGVMHLMEAKNRIEQIQALRNPQSIETESVAEVHLGQDATPESMILQEFTQDPQMAAIRILNVQDSYKDALYQIEALQQQLQDCQKRLF